jgi:ribose 5-phosphate isomerase B
MRKSTGKDIAIASDHGGFDLKRHLVKYLLKQGHAVIDLGPRSRASVDYPDYARRVAEAVAAGEIPLGILLCGTGIGMSIVANRYQGVRAALAHDTYTARLAKAHNNANVLVLGGRVTGPGLAEEIVDTWLKTRFEGGRHQRRVNLVDGES